MRKWMVSRHADLPFGGHLAHRQEVKKTEIGDFDFDSSSPFPAGAAKREDV